MCPVRRSSHRWVAWSLCAAWAGVIFYFSSRAGSSLPGGYSIQGHLGEYFILGALLTWALADEAPGVSTVVLAVLLASLYGVSDEFHQQFVPMRTPDVLDWALDTTGATIGALGAMTALLRVARTRQHPAGSDAA